MDRDTVPSNLPERRLRLRSQLSLELAAGAGDGLTIEDVIELKHSPRMLLRSGWWTNWWRRPKRQSHGEPNHGKKPRNFNQDCTICHSCR